MTHLIVHEDTAPFARRMETDDPARIAATVAVTGALLERWPVQALPRNARDEDILTAYAPQIQARGGYRSHDLIRMTPDHPSRVELRQTFLSEHIHDDDEVRFFVEGSGLFCLHHEGLVYALTCTAGDLIVLSAGTRHWFDTGEHPRFTAIRLFDNPQGWIARYTGDPIAAALFAGASA